MVIFTVEQDNLTLLSGLNTFYDIDWANYKKLINTFTKSFHSFSEANIHHKLNLFIIISGKYQENYFILFCWRFNWILNSPSILNLIQLSLFLCTFDTLRNIWEENYVSNLCSSKSCDLVLLGQFYKQWLFNISYVSDYDIPGVYRECKLKIWKFWQVLNLWIV